MNLLPNPSFEIEAAGRPQGWHCEGPTRPGGWLSEGRDGGKCLAMRGVVGRTEWRSDVVPIPERPVLLWWTKIAGSEPWHWSYLVNFVGVIARYLDAQGRPMGEEPHWIRCIRTEGWVRAWLRLAPPAGAAQVSIAFVWDAPFETNGQVWVDDAALVDEPSLALQPGCGRLRCKIADAETGRPLAARCHVTVNGQAQQPTCSLDYPGLGGAFHAGGEWELAAVGKVCLRVARGSEYEPWLGEVEVGEGETVEVAVPLRRLTDMAGAGWYGGDHHSHLFFHGHTRHPQMTVEDAMNVAEAEGLHFLPLQAEIGEMRAALGREIGSREGFIGALGLEVVSDYWGHVCTINVQREPEFGFPLRQIAYPTNEQVCEAVVGAGGAVAYPHPLNNAAVGQVLAAVGNPERLLLARELPVDLALGYPSGYDLLGEDDPQYLDSKLGEYYRLLDLGFPVALTAATDYYQDQGKGVPGAVRTYVHADRLSWPDVAAGYRQAATFCTNGPLLLLEGVGERRPVTAGQPMELAVSAFSPWGLDRLEIVRGGEVVATFDCQGRRGVSFTASIDLPDGTDWVAARVYGPPAREIDSRVLPAGMGQFAHTSAAWLEVEDRPHRPKLENVRHYQQWVAAVRESWQVRRSMLPEAAERTGIAAEELERRILGMLDRAEAFYQGLEANAR